MWHGLSQQRLEFQIVHPSVFNICILYAALYYNLQLLFHCIGTYMQIS